MNLGHNYTYRFFYKIGFFMLLIVCAGLSFAWIGTSISRDNSRTMEIFWRKLFIRDAIIMNQAIRERDILIDVITAQDKGVCEIYCEQLRQFKMEHAKRHGNGE